MAEEQKQEEQKQAPPTDGEETKPEIEKQKEAPTPSDEKSDGSESRSQAESQSVGTKPAEPAKSAEPVKEEAKEDVSSEASAKDDDDVDVDDPRFKDIVSKVGEMSVVDLADLVKVLEKKFGVSAAAPVAAGGAGAGGGEEKSVFTVVLKAVGGQKINVIKAVKDMLGVGLKEAKDLVEAAPKPLKEGVKKEDAEEMKKKLEEVGATVELQ